MLFNYWIMDPYWYLGQLILEPDKALEIKPEKIVEPRLKKIYNIIRKMYIEENTVDVVKLLEEINRFEIKVTAYQLCIGMEKFRNEKKEESKK